MKFLLYFAIFFILLSPISYCMGVLQKEFYAEMYPGEVKEFKLLFWNTENFDYPVTLSSSTTTDVQIAILPENFYLNKENSYKTFEYVARDSSYVKAFPVKVLVKASGKAYGEKIIYVKAVAGSLTNSTISTFQEKIFTFHINVKGVVKSSEIKEEKAKSPLMSNITIEKIGEKLKEKKSNISTFLFIFFIILIITISLKIYKW